MAGWVAGSIGTNANSASVEVEVEVEVEAELGNYVVHCMTRLKEYLSTFLTFNIN